MYSCDRYNDPFYIRKCKLAILIAIADNNNFRDIVGEFSEYVRDSDAKFAREAVSAVGEIGTRLPNGAEHVLGQLLSFLDMDLDTIAAETIVALKGISFTSIEFVLNNDLHRYASKISTML